MPIEVHSIGKAFAPSRRERLGSPGVHRHGRSGPDLRADREAPPVHTRPIGLGPEEWNPRCHRLAADARLTRPPKGAVSRRREDGQSHGPFAWGRVHEVEEVFASARLIVR